MSSLRRDLIERRLWPIVIVLIAAIVAVPFLLHGHRGGAGAMEAAAVPPAGSSSSGQSVAVSDRHQQKVPLPTSASRDPFESLLPGRSSSADKPKAKRPSAASGASTSTTSTSTTASSSPSGSASGSGAASSSAAGNGTGASGSSSTGAGTGTGTTPTKTPTVTPVVEDPATGATSKGPWTIYSVDATLTGPGWKQADDDLTRLVPLPKATWPRVMFMGAVDTGRQAVFALATGVEASGAGSCEPSRSECEMVVLSRGQTEHLSYLLGDGTQRSMTLKVGAISSRVTDSVSEAVSAFDRHSGVGLCELQLGDPIDFKYDVTSGSLQSTTATSACRVGMKAVPFPGSGSGL